MIPIPPLTNFSSLQFDLKGGKIHRHDVKSVCAQQKENSIDL